MHNATSGPGASSCGCNGQDTRQADVSGKITNTGTRAGSDVVQLYLGDRHRPANRPGSSRTSRRSPWPRALHHRTGSTSVPLDAAKTVRSITLPDSTPATSANGQLETHIFAAAIAKGSSSP